MIPRRQFLAGLAAATVVGFNPLTRSWVSVAQASSPFDGIPPLDGELLTDPASLAPVSIDAGYMIVTSPVAVLRPGSVEDISKMVRFCKRHRIKVGARGTGHTVWGQSQVDGGLVIEMGSLNQIHAIEPTFADVDAGVLWKDLLLASVPEGIAPPALTGFTGLSIAGTLSVGGMSPTYNRGAQVDNVRALQIVTGEGDVHWCSEHDNRDLFLVALGGLGQCGIITRAIIDMAPQAPQTRMFLLNYTDNATFFRDFRTLLRRGEFNDLSNLWVPDGNGGWIYQLNAVSYFDPANPPNNDHLLRGLSFDPTSVQVIDNSYINYILRVDFQFDFLKAIGLWTGVMHPWFDVFLPDWSVERYVGDIIPILEPDDVGLTGLVLLFAQKRSKLTRPFLRMPRAHEWVFLFDVLTANVGPGPDPAFQARMLNRNREFFEKARRVGATRYPIGALEFSHRDWIIQYGEKYSELVRLKRRFDPRNILTPGPQIFT
jgi:cytokinin dehydrogenase